MLKSDGRTTKEWTARRLNRGHALSVSSQVVGGCWSGRLGVEGERDKGTGVACGRVGDFCLGLRFERGESLALSQIWANGIGIGLGIGLGLGLPLPGQN